MSERLIEGELPAALADPIPLGIRTDDNVHAGIEVLASGAKALAVSQVANQLVRFGTNVVLARLLAPREFGLMTIALVVMVFLDQFRDLGTGVAVIQRRHLTQDLLNTVFFLNTLLGIALGAVLFMTAGPITSLVASDGDPNVLRAFAGITVLAALGQIHHALLRRDLHLKQLAIVNLSNAVVNGVVSVVLAILEFGVWALVIGTLAGALADTSVVWYFDRWRPTRQFSLSSLRAIAAFSGNLFGSNLVGFFFAQSDKILVARILGPSPLGIYGMATRILTYPLTSIASIVSEVSFPAFARRQDDDASLRDGFVRASSLVALVTFPLMAMVAAVARPAVETVFDANWESLTPLIWILAPVGAIQSVTGATYSLLMAKGQAGLLFRWVIFSSAVSFAGYIIGLHWDGLIGLCWATAITVGFLTPFSLVIIFPRIGLTLREFVRPLVPISFTAGVGAGVALGVDNVVGRVAGPAVVLFAGLITGFATVAGLTMWFRPQPLQDGLTVLRSRGGNSSPAGRGGNHRSAAPARPANATSQPVTSHLVSAPEPAATRPRGRHRHP